jgi:serine/threonine protein kinase/Flp pilus assembly protein TadD
MGLKCPKCHFDNPNDTIYCVKCTTPLKPSEEISPTKTLETSAKGLTSGTTFASRYEIVEELGKGGMGRVYKALDKEINEEVAIKLIKPEIASDESTVERFRNELKFSRKIAHKNVCKMYHIAKEEETPYITMEYVPGEDLKSLEKRKGKLTDEEAISIAKQVCEGLAEAHELGVVHRDLKPQNIMIDERDRAKIMDFGIARSVEAPGVTQTGVMIGTPDYISPEQAEGEEADQRSDIYSLGTILYEMVTGRVPFEGDTALSVALKHKAQFPQDPRKLNPQISEDLSRLILICMEKDKERRYQTAGELLSDLDKIEKGIPIKERRLLKKKLEIKRKRVLLYGGASLLLIFAIASAIYLFIGRAGTIDSIAVLPFENLTGDTEQEIFVDGITNEMIGQLAKIGSLRVISRTSVMQYKGTDKLLPEIAQELNVDVLVEGSVQRSGDRIRIRAQLFHGSTDTSLWTESYERDLWEILSLQSEVAQSIADEIKVKLTPEERELISSTRRINPESYEAYLRGMFYVDQETPEGIEKGLAYLREAIEKDPAHALPYAGLAMAYNTIGHGPSPPPDAFVRAKAAALRALELDDTLAEAHAALAIIELYGGTDWDWAGAGLAFQRALEFNSSLGRIQINFGWYHILYERFDEAIEAMKKAKKVDPLHPLFPAYLGWVYWSIGRNEEAMDEVLKSLELDPDYVIALYVQGLIYASGGMYEEAIETHQKAAAINPDWKWGLGHSYALAGRRDEALEIAAELESQPQAWYTWGLAEIYAALGEKDKAFRWLEEAYEQRHSYLPWLRWNPNYAPLFDDPRFDEIARRMNLPDMDETPE